ncbi:MAG TPA: flagellar biosynthesis repressor FlbT [Devosia sp.]|nr:flagellar biosynthesis repressor FlbT [Devosia sp.]
MALRILVKPGEKVHLGTSNIIVVAEAVVTIIIEGTIPVLRDGDFLEAGTADTPARKAYRALQDIYLHSDVNAGRDSYFDSVRTLLHDLPSAADFVTQINGHLASNEFYRALKVGRSVVQLDEHAQSWAEITTS